jgi:hypothetical protein
VRKKVPNTYYSPDSGVAIALNWLKEKGPTKVAVVGLGTGTLAAFGRTQDDYTFYEINPNVPLIAKEYFTYITDTPAKVHIELGDARISMERQQPQNYDLIALDAFSGDAIPVHLLTKESFEKYFEHLKPDGVIAVHISNRHLDLVPVVYGMSEHFKAWISIVDCNRDAGVGEAASEWVIITKNRELMDSPGMKEAGKDVPPDTKRLLWTDQYSNLFEILE